MREHVDADPDVVDHLRAICTELPEAYQERAWVGTRWRIRSNTFVHTVSFTDGWPPAYVRAAGTPGPATVITFESAGEELEALRLGGHPFFKPPWRSSVIGVFVDADTDWSEIAELVTDSYCLLAPKRLAESVRSRYG